MSISPKYIELLKHIGKTITLDEFRQTESGVALRHDIDYDLDLALEIAHLENSMGFKATFFMLDTAAYWRDPNFEDKILQIQDFGHEIGLHVNSLAKWAEGNCISPELDFRNNVKRLREIGIKISGIAAHGDPACYRFNVANYWMFSELRPINPYEVENYKTAEGIFDTSTTRVLAYPPNDLVENINGEKLQLWQTSMYKEQINYHASHLKYENYYSDSGGKWRNNSNPLNEVRLSDSTQILVHPEHWKGEKKIYFFLSTARSSSKWLAQILNTATSCQAKHEFTLNYDPEETEGYKNTQTNFQKIQVDEILASQLIINSAEYISKTTKNWAECNIYLPHVLNSLATVFPNARYIHLKRNTELVVNSLINRNWYDTPNDTIHPIIDFESYNAISQIQRCTSYVLDTQNAINSIAEHELDQKKLVTDFEYFTKEMEALGIAVYPRLAKKIYYEKINKNKFETFGSPADWTNEMHVEFKTIMQNFHNKNNVRVPKIEFKKHIITSFDGKKGLVNAAKLIFGIGTPGGKINFRGHHSDLKKVNSGVRIINSPGKNSYFSIGGSNWYEQDGVSGFKIENDAYFEGHIQLFSEEKNVVSVFCIFFESGKQIKKRILYSGPTDGRDIHFSFPPFLNAQKFDIFCYFPARDKPVETYLTKIILAINRRC